MLFIDDNCMWNIVKMIGKNNDLESQRQYLIQEIEKDNLELKEIDNLKGMERYGRERYYLKRENEDIYIIQYDTLQ